MNKILVLCALLLNGVQLALAQTGDAASVSDTATNAATNWGEVALGILVLICALAIIAHMIYECFIKKPHDALTVETCQNARKEQGLKPMTEAEAGELLVKMDDILDSWTSYKGENEEDLWVMTKYSQTKKTLALLDEVAAALPDNEDVVSRYNQLNDHYNEAMKRQYNGSNAYIILCVVVAALLCWAGGSTGWYNVAIMFALQIAVYWLASMTPTYLLNKKALSTSRTPKFMNGMIAGILGLAATAPTYTTVTKWSDGSETKEEDNSAFWFSAIFSFLFNPLVCNRRIFCSLIIINPI